MNIAKFGLAAVGIALATTAAAQTTSLDSGPVKIAEDKITRTIDCNGRDLMVSSDSNILTIKNCVTINVVGNRNQVTAQLLPTSTIAALGNDNHIVFFHAPGFEVQVTSSGKKNEIIPQMNRDLNDRSLVKFPIQSRVGKE